MPDIDFAPATRDIHVGQPGAVLDVGTAATDDGVWTAYVTERDGTVIAALDAVNLGKIRERLNAPPTFSFDVPKAFADAVDVERVTREVQVFRSGGNPKFVGPILQRAADSGDGKMGHSAAGVAWYLSHRLRGGYVPWSRNYIENPRFDAGFDRWTLTGAGISLDADSETGTDSALLANSVGASIKQMVYIDLAVTYQAVVEARVKLSASATTGRGLEVTVPGVQGGDTFRSVPITADTPNGAWTSLTAVMNIEGRVGARSLTAEVFDTVGDDIRVDHVSVTIFPMETYGPPSSVPPTQVDQAQIIRETIQATNNDLHLGVSCPDTGSLVDYLPDEDVDRMADEIIARYVKREGGLEWDIVATPTTRTFTTYYPRKGRTISAAEVTLRTKAGDGDPRNCSSYRLSEDATEAVSEMTTLGEGEYRGVYQDPAAWGGLLLQAIQSAPEGTPLADLEGLSRKSLRSSIGDVQALQMTVTDGDLIDTILLGDYVAVVIDDLAVQIADDYRVVERELDPATDTMLLTLNLVTA